MRRRARRRASSCARCGFSAVRARPPRGTKPEIGRGLTAMSGGGITAEIGFRTGFDAATSAGTGGDANRADRRAANAPVKSPVEAFKIGEPTESGTDEGRGGGGAGATTGTGGNEGNKGGEG